MAGWSSPGDSRGEDGRWSEVPLTETRRLRFRAVRHLQSEKGQLPAIARAGTDDGQKWLWKLNSKGLANGVLVIARRLPRLRVEKGLVSGEETSPGDFPGVDRRR